MSSPNILYYSVLKGIVKFTPTDGVQRDLGNAPSFVLTPSVETLEHESSRAGIASVDRKVVTKKALKIKIVLDEWSAQNLAMKLMGGAVTNNTSGNQAFRIFASSEITGAIEFTGTNDIGSKVHLDLPSVSFTPEGDLELVTTEWGQMELAGDVLYVEELGDFGGCEIDAPAGVEGSV